MDKFKLFSALCIVCSVGMVTYLGVVLLDEAIEATQSLKPAEASAKPILTTSQREWVKECAKYTDVTSCLFRLGELKQEQVWN